MRQNIILICLLVLFAFACQSETDHKKIDLSGTWSYALDSLDKGIAEQWYNQQLEDSLQLPGSLTSNNIGDEISLSTPWTGQIVDSSFFKSPKYANYRVSGNIKIPFWLQPVKYYKGAAWYQKELTIPKNWDSQSISLYLERCHWESRVWIDNKEVGMQNSLGTAHQYDLTNLIAPGKHKITVCIDNRVKDIDPGINSHSISDHTQSNWNGIVGQMYLEARPLVKISNIQIFPDVANRKLKVKLKLNNSGEGSIQTTLKIAVTNSEEKIKNTSDLELSEGESTQELMLEMGDNIKLWSEFHPNIYMLEASLTNKIARTIDKQKTTFGFREIKAEGNQLTINGKPLFLRGTLECAIFPKTGYPPTDVTEWLRIFNVCRAHGLNHTRFHSWCPPEAAFDAADQTGFYLQVECSSWANQSTTLGDGKPFDQYLYDESRRMIEAYGNHPSFCMMAYGNEPSGSHKNEFLTSFIRYWKEQDSRRIYTSAAGWPNLPINDYLSDSNPRIQRWGEELKSIINSQTPSTNFDWSSNISQFTQPMVSHEIGQWCVYPNFKEIVKYDGVLKAKNFEIFKESLKEQGMEELADSFLLASGKLQALCYKADIEAALRTKRFGGFQLLDLHDFPGQGTALVGVLDPFWEEKGYISPKEYRRFCNSTVPLIRMKKHIFTNNENFMASSEVAHFGDQPITNCTPKWTVTDKHKTIVQYGKLEVTDIPIGNGFALGDIVFSLTSITTPEKLTLELSIDSLSNSWDFWVYPASKEVIPGADKISLVQKVDDQLLEFVKKGGTVLLSLKKGSLSPEMGGDVQIGFSSIFWNTAWTHGQAPHTLGILVNPSHPAFAKFPTEYHSNWQWWDAMSHSCAINLLNFPAEIKPIIRVIDDWFTNRPLALVFEAKFGKGKILISGVDFIENMENRQEAQQLLYSLKKYMASEQFHPNTELTAAQIKQISN